ncbi:MAG TPA: asparagine synthase-related protein [Bryobacteraceae bacterium]|jgi:asparagine synthase (glutamine-hydrolysing)|nr:asparagine synthase-related protein [Bryobacteraceae bacterium]
MAGIWASIGLDPCANFTSVVSHRGGERRQACFESAAGMVCMESTYRPGGPRALADAGEWHMVFDGWLYNETEQRTQVLRLHWPHALDSAAAVALAAFATRGEAALPGLSGCFSFVVWNAATGEIHAVRDRFGLKPLYVYEHPRGIAFASEIKQFFQLPGSRASLDRKRCADFLIAGVTDHSTATMFERVRRVPAGGLISLSITSLRTGVCVPVFRQWYRLPVPGSIDIGEEDAVAHFRELLFAAVESQLGQSGKAALCLSGGLDSASIAGIWAAGPRAATRPLLAFKASFGDARYDEPELLRSVLESTGARIHETHCGPEESFSQLEPLIWHLDEPSARASLAGQWLLFRLAASMQVDYTLDGQGSDEQLGGYTSMVEEHHAHRRGESFAPGASSRSVPSSGGLTWQQAQTWLSAEFLSGSNLELGSSNGARPRDLGSICAHRMVFGDLPMMMRQNDRIGMAHGIETHVPFLDERVVEFSIGLGSRHKLPGQETKHLLRRAMRGLVPRLVLESRVKGSYSALECEWLRERGWRLLVRVVRQTTATMPRVFRPEAFAAITPEQPQQAKDVLLFLWRVAVFGVWAKRFEVSQESAT